MAPILVGLLLDDRPNNLDGVVEEVQVLSNAGKFRQRIQRMRPVCDVGSPRFPENDGLLGGLIG